VETFETDQLIDAIGDVLAAVVTLGDETVTADQAQLPTDCPGWTVHDQFAHIVGLEQVLNGAPEPAMELPALAHVVTDLDRYMEKHVHIRRLLPFQSVVDELAGFLPRRMDTLYQTADEEGDPMVKGPFGERPLSVSLPVRVFDLWAHEQDIRRALSLPPRLDCDAARISLSRSLVGWSKSLDGTLTGVNGLLEVIVEGDDEIEGISVRLGAGGPTVRLQGDVGQLTRAFCGRGEPDRSLFSGDETLIDALHGKLALTP